MPKVWFIRHGESVSNANLPTSHPAESALTPRGEEEARLITSAFEQAPDLIVVSPFLRARQTAVPTQTKFPDVPLEEWPVHEFTYLHPERYSGTTGSERGPYAQAYWKRNDPFEKEQGEGESFAELLMRVQEMLRRLQKAQAEFIVVFSHGLFLRAVLWHLITGIDEPTKDAMWRYQQFIWGVWMPNCSIVELVIAHDQPIMFSGFLTAHLDNS
jgi:2,3-bisphosphoglycerate-dependent phosphoglycerate mutase